MMGLTSEAIRSSLESVGSLLRGHFVLSSGLHTNQYVQCAKVFEQATVAETLCTELAERCRPLKPEVVVGPAFGGIILAYELARHLKARSMFVERFDGQFKLRRGFRIEPGTRVLIAEDVVTTGESLAEAVRVVEKEQATVCGAASIIDRRTERAGPDTLVSLLKLDVPVYPASDCPLCAEGIPARAPGSRKATRR